MKLRNGGEHKWQRLLQWMKYIADKLIKHIEAKKAWQKGNAILFNLYDIKMRACNHRGSIDEVTEYAEKCNLYKAYVEAEEYIIHVIRVIESYINSFKLKEALEEYLKLKAVAVCLEKNI